MSEWDAWEDSEEFNAEDTMDAVWAVDSETGKEVLIDRKTNRIIATREQVEGK